MDILHNLAFGFEHALTWHNLMFCALGCTVGTLGGLLSALAMKIPHASSIVACIDVYAMTLKGKCGLALFTAGVSSFIGGTVAIIVLATLAPMLGEVALLF